MKGIKKFYIGFSVLGFLTLVLLIVVAAKGSTYKHDKKVNSAAVEIAEDLNGYVKDESRIPDELKDATREEIPSEVSYKKIDKNQYEFCITYKAESQRTTSAQSVLYNGLSGNFGSSSSSYDYSSRTRSNLYVSSYSWNEGETCYRVKPVFSTKYNRSYYFGD